MTFEEIDLLVRRANPVPDPSVLGPLPSAGETDVRSENDVRRGTAMQIQDLSRTEELNSTTEIQHRADKRFPRGWVAIAAAAVVIVVALVAISAGTGGDDSNDVAALPTVSAAALADSFVAALADHDAAAAMSYLTADSLLEAGGPDVLARELRWEEATGLQRFFEECREVGRGTESTVVRCPYAYHGVRSGDLGLDPYEGSSYRIVVRDGWIDGFADQIEYDVNGFSDDVWEPFHAWLLANHPDDVSVMFTDDSAESFSTTDESIALWERRSQEYVEAVG